MVGSWRRCIGEGEVEVEGEKFSGKSGRHFPNPSTAAPAESKKGRLCGSCSAAESTYRNRIQKPRSGAAADALDFDWRKDERSDVLNLDGNAAGQASYRQAGLPFPLIDCGSGDWSAKVVTKRCQKG
jgi:hypothetical protein